ncbi:MAG: hypothetical protein K8R58_15430 [Bacteroidales bacterium]|nr:hypothetical protein [Bacteroidales bacterium]
MNDTTDIIKNIFNLLAISTSVAAFLPALVYSYFTTFTTKMVEQIENKPDFISSNEESKDWVKKIVSFSYAIDLILTLIIFLIFFTSINSLVLYIHAYKLEEYWLITLLITLWSFFCLMTILFFIYSLRSYRKARKYVVYWEKRCIYTVILFSLILIYAIIEVWFSIRICKGWGSVEDNQLWMVSISTFMIVLSVVLWIVPIFSYRPLVSEINKAIDKFHNK